MIFSIAHAETRNSKLAEGSSGDGNTVREVNVCEKRKRVAGFEWSVSGRQEKGNFSSIAKWVEAVPPRFAYFSNSKQM